MTGAPPRRIPADELLARLLRRAGEPLASMSAEVGFAAAVRVYVRAARRIAETSPEAGGQIAIRGVRDEGAVWLVGDDAERVWVEVGEGNPTLTPEHVSRLLASIFCAIAYRHPYFDGNKRTGFLAAVLIGRDLGMRMQQLEFESIEADVIEFTAREAPAEEVAGWLLEKVFIAHRQDEGVLR